MNRKLVLAALFGAVSADDLCCEACPEGTIKTYSVDHFFNMCGESCMKESDFWKYKLFEPGLTKADALDQGICALTGFTEYSKTEAHGIPGLITIKLDMYNKPKSEEAAFTTPNSVCDGLDENTCDANSACNWCTCYAVPSRCWTMEDSARLPMAIWECDKDFGETPAVDEVVEEQIVKPVEEETPAIIEQVEEPIQEPIPFEVTPNSVCDGLEQNSCDANSACNWCECYAVPSRCWTMEDSARLPMAIWECDKQFGEIPAVVEEQIVEPVEEETPAIIEEVEEPIEEPIPFEVTPNSVCDGLEQNSCDANSACNWCECYAVPSRCWTMEDSARLPMAIWECDKQFA